MWDFPRSGSQDENAGLMAISNMSIRIKLLKCFNDLFVMFDLILFVSVNIFFSFEWDGSSWVEPGISKDYKDTTHQGGGGALW